MRLVFVILLATTATPIHAENCRNISVDRIPPSGDAKQVDALLKKLEHDHCRRIYLGGFGSIVIDKVMKEVDDPSIPDDDKNQIIGAIRDAGGHESLPKYLELLHHQNPFVARMAAEGIARIAQPGDRDTLINMLADSNHETRWQALRGLNKIWTKDDAKITMDRLRSDQDEIVRSQAAQMLGDHRVCEAAAVLKLAEHDGSAFLRGDVRSALDKLTNSQNLLPRAPLASQLRVVPESSKGAVALQYLKNGNIFQQWFPEITALTPETAIPFYKGILDDPAAMAGLHRTRAMVAAEALMGAGERKTVLEAAGRLMEVGDYSKFHQPIPR